jgi:hypothetical protein
MNRRHHAAHTYSASRHGAPSPVLFDYLLSVVLPPARWAARQSIYGSMLRYVLVRRLRGLLLFPLGLLCTVLFGCLAALLDFREYRHGGSTTFKP